MVGLGVKQTTEKNCDFLICQPELLHEFLMVMNILVLIQKITLNFFLRSPSLIVYSHFMHVCSIVKTITPRCRGRSDAPSAIMHQVVHSTEG